MLSRDLLMLRRMPDSCQMNILSNATFLHRVKITAAQDISRLACKKSIMITWDYQPGVKKKLSWDGLFPNVKSKTITNISK